MYIAPKIRHVSMIVLVVSGESEALARPSLATLSTGPSFFLFFCLCLSRYCHIWVLGGHLILFILFCAWVLGDRFVTCAAAGGRITINQNEPNVVIRQSSIQYRTARSRRGMPRHATCRQQDTKLCCRCALPTMEEPWMQQRELDEVFGPKSMMHIEPRSVLLLVNH